MAHSQYDGATGLPNLLKLIHDMRRFFSAGGVVIGLDVQPEYTAADSLVQYPDGNSNSVQTIVAETLLEMSSGFGECSMVYQIDESEYALVLSGQGNRWAAEVVRRARLALDWKVMAAGLPGITVFHTVVTYPDEAQDIAALLTMLHVGLAHTVDSRGRIATCNTGPIDDLVRRFSQTLDNILGLQQLAYVDSVTGLSNHRAAELGLEDMVAASEKGGQQFSILFVDGDHLKQYNDRYGYEAGNDLIRAMGVALQRLSRPQDDVYRWLSGDEFLVIMPGADRDEATAAAEYIRLAMADYFSQWDIAVTVSIGVAGYPVDGCTVGELIQAGTVANMFAKQAGRNCVRTWGAVKA